MTDLANPATADADYSARCEAQDYRDEVIKARVADMMNDLDAVSEAISELNIEIASVLINGKDVVDRITSTVEAYLEEQVEKHL